MKILYFMNHADQGGAALALYDLIVELKKKEDLKIIVITGKKNELNKMLTDIDIENYNANFKNFMSSEKRPKWIWKILFRLRHDLSFYIARRKIEKVIDFSTIDIIHSNLNRIDIGAYFAKKYNKKHVWHIREHAKGDFELIPIYKNYISYMNSFDSNFVAISKSVMNVWCKRGIKKNNIKLIYDGVKVNKFPQKSDKSKECLKIIFMGGYNGNKGQEYLIDAIAALDKEIINCISIDFYGSGLKEKRQYLEEKIRSNKLEKVITLNNYNSNIQSKISEYDVGINCSTMEGFGRVTVEYMMAGLCVIASNQGANTELITDKESGLLYNYGDKMDLANKIKYIYNNLEKCKLMGKAAQRRAVENFSIETHAKNIYHLYQELINK